jgi:uncharacterized protein (DUF3084 family)
MNKGVVKNLAFILLLGVAIFSMVRYVSELRSRLILQEDLTKVQGELLVLKQEEQNLLQELGKEKELNQRLEAKNAKLKAYLEASQNRISRLFKDNQNTQSALDDVSAKFAVLKAENTVLIQSRKRVYLENEQLKSKFNSVAELRKAIRALRFSKPDAPAPLTNGNRGYLIRDGRSTSEKVKIEVVPDAP